MSKVNLKFIGRFGNQMFQYAFARGYAEASGSRLHTENWVGQALFEIDDPPIDQSLPRIPEESVGTVQSDVELFGYAQNQTCANYYAGKYRDWFKIRPSIKAKLADWSREVTAFHLRRDDYVNSTYPIVGRLSYETCVALNGLDEDVVAISDDYPSTSCLPSNLAFFQDFYYLMTAKNMLRANSSFSFWAGALSSGRIFAPIITGKQGYQEHHDVPFVEGNWPRIAELGFITDIHI